MNIFQIFENSYQIERIETEKNITPDFAAYKLAKNFEHRSSQEYWASIQIGNIDTRYHLENGNGELKVIASFDITTGEKI